MKVGQTKAIGDDQQTGRRKWFGHSKCNEKEGKKSNFFALLCGVHKKKEKKPQPKPVIELVRNLDQGDAVHVAKIRDVMGIEKRGAESSLKKPNISGGQKGIVGDVQTGIG